MTSFHKRACRSSGLQAHAALCGFVFALLARHSALAMRVDLKQMFDDEELAADAAAQFNLTIAATAKEPPLFGPIPPEHHGSQILVSSDYAFQRPEIQIFAAPDSLMEKAGKLEQGLEDIVAAEVSPWAAGLIGLLLGGVLFGSGFCVWMAFNRPEVEPLSSNLMLNDGLIVKKSAPSQKKASSRQRTIGEEAIGLKACKAEDKTGGLGDVRNVHGTSLSEPVKTAKVPCKMKNSLKLPVDDECVAMGHSMTLPAAAKASKLGDVCTASDSCSTAASMRRSSMPCILQYKYEPMMSDQSSEGTSDEDGLSDDSGNENLHSEYPYRWQSANKFQARQYAKTLQTSAVTTARSTWLASGKRASVKAKRRGSWQTGDAITSIFLDLPKTAVKLCDEGQDF